MGHSERSPSGSLGKQQAKSDFDNFRKKCIPSAPQAEELCPRWIALHATIGSRSQWHGPGLSKGKGITAKRCNNWVQTFGDRH
mmetsp:Transcript_15603/g.32287  ORF Transcript_15603/g.32287 Transcript_15603/m.32287 type:complete len:83 (-) Transcript_15603:73-321(-)